MSSRKRTATFLFSFALGVISANTGTAQVADSVDAPYSHVVIRVSALRPVSIGTLKSYYATSTGAAIDAEIPFEAGSLGVTFGWTTLKRHPSNDGVPAPSFQNFRARLIGINWRLPVVELGRTRARLGLRAATFRLLLGDTLATMDNLTEDELSLGVTGNIALRLHPSIRASIGGDVSRVFSNIPWTISTVTAGVEWVHPLPRRLRDWLR